MSPTQLSCCYATETLHTQTWHGLPRTAFLAVGSHLNFLSILFAEYCSSSAVISTFWCSVSIFCPFTRITNSSSSFPNSLLVSELDSLNKSPCFCLNSSHSSYSFSSCFPSSRRHTLFSYSFLNTSCSFNIAYNSCPKTMLNLSNESII